MSNKYERFKVAAEHSGLVANLDTTIGKWGRFHVDHAEVVLLVAKLESVDASLLAVTWQNESAFKFYPEPNKNGTDDVSHWDTGAIQLNIGNIERNIANQFLNVQGINVQRALETTADIFRGDPIENLRLGARFLQRIGRGTITGPSQTVLQRALPPDEWAATSDADKNMRRAVAYTGPNARPFRFQSWLKFGPLFDTFFKLYNGD